MKLTNTARWASGLAVAFALAAPARAQEETKPASADSKAESEAMPEGNEVRPLPGWSIKPELKTLEEAIDSVYKKRNEPSQFDEDTLRPKEESVPK